MNQKYKQTSISLDDETKRIIEEAQRNFYLSSLSGALRLIIREWHADRYRITDKGRNALTAERERTG